ncbi:hypothetical protein Poli38472_012839 [Pythium oligandrum]|uniref:Serine/threonine-protein phosphatase 1 regulatory subunit 10 n=1 Tax=Pythium oligandrum TaxID=41045 RepID=A0A8K1FLV4_PYTOL|nr:hypothetical protein Poli38472_012839 [Pythium oligandrum]|eukprot:TMW64217.1 hypothetical protein Poli38472_012839 [Pythium oligandrum]
MQAQVTAVVPDVLKQLIWEPAAVNETQPVNPTETALMPLIDDKLQVRSVAHIPKFLQVLLQARTEADEALVLVILRATATSSDVKLAKACTSAFEKCDGLKVAMKWLTEAVEWNYNDLLVLLLEVLKTLPVQLASITAARINEPIVKLRKTAQEEKVRRAAQDLLKHWRSRFTEKEKANKAAAAAAAEKTKAETKPVASATPTVSSTMTSTPRTASDAALKDAKPLKKRPIKRIGSSNTTTPAKPSGLIGNLMQRKTAKDAAAAAAAASSSSSSTKLKDNSTDSSESMNASSESKDEEPMMQLPTITSFNAEKSTVTAKASKRIRWADESGSELVKVKLIESWRDMIHYQPHEESFKDAKLREHADERLAMKSHKEREAFHVVVAHEWSLPAMVKLPEQLAPRREPVNSEEAAAQSARTRREMEFLVLDGEVPPVSPKEWTRANEPHRGAPFEIPLSDVASGAPATPAEPMETAEERALREALGPLQRSTIALLMENEDVLPQVYEEAQRNNNHIPDGRVLEIIDYRRRQQHQRYNAPPQQGGYAYGGAYNGPPPQANGYDYPPRGFHNGPPPGSLKRKAPGPNGGGILADAPPPKRLPKRGPNGAPPQCMYFMSPNGCKHGHLCQFAHDGPNNEYSQGYPQGGGRFGPPGGGMGMRGGMRSMRGGR